MSGRFEIDEPPPEEPGLLMTSMIDVIFILLAAFVCVSEVRKGTLNVDLPEVTDMSPRRSEGSETLLIEITADNKVYVDGKHAATNKELTLILEQKAEKFGSRVGQVPVEIAGDDKGDHGMTMKVLGHLSKAGFRKFQFAVEGGG